MASLFNIEQELINIFDIIEENCGEVDDNLLEKLNITQEEFKKKCQSYYYAIKDWENNAAACKVEKKRVGDTQKRFENRVNRLKNILLDALIKFGDDGKSGNKVLELPTVKFFTRNTIGVEVNEYRMKLLCSYFAGFVQEVYANGVLTTGENVDLQGIIDSINAVYKADAELHNEPFEPFVVQDLNLIQVDIKTTDTLANMFIKHTDALVALGSEPIYASVVPIDVNKVDLKNTLNSYKNIPDIEMPTFANLTNNTSLQIK